MARNDYIPTRDAEFDGWLGNLTSYVAAHTIGPKATAEDTADWPNIPTATVTALVAAYDAWHLAFLDTRAAHTKPQTEKKNEKRKDAEALLRPFVAQYLRFPPVTNEDRTAMNIRNHDTKPTPTPRPLNQATAKHRPLGDHLIELVIEIVGAPLTDANASDYGFRIYWGIMPTGGASKDDALSKHRYLMAPPENGDDLPFSRFTRKKKEVFDFDEKDRGKRVYFDIRLENAKGEPGPWGPIVDTIIP
jgi:hypothetical protein